MRGRVSRRLKECPTTSEKTFCKRDATVTGENSAVDIQQCNIPICIEGVITYCKPSQLLHEFLAAKVVSKWCTVTNYVHV